MKILKFIIIFTGFSFLAGIWMNFSLPGQVNVGDIYGMVVLPDGSTIPGAIVTLTGEKIGKLTTVSSED